MTILCVNWVIVGTVATGIGAIATAWMALQTGKSNNNAKEAIIESRQNAFFNMIVSMYSNSRKIIEQMVIIAEDCVLPQKPFGLECLTYIYNVLFKTALTKRINKRLPPSEQKEETVIPEKSSVKESFDKIVHVRYPNLGNYMSSVVAIIERIDAENYINKEYRDNCVMYMKSLVSTKNLTF